MKKNIILFLLLFFLVPLFLLSSCKNIIEDEENTERQEPLVIFTFTNNSQYKTRIGLNVSEPMPRGFNKGYENFDLEAKQHIIKSKNYYDNESNNFCLVKYIENDILIYLVSFKKLNLDNANINIIIDNTNELDISGNCKILSTQSWNNETWGEQF